MRRRLAEREERKVLKRREALHELYMHAREFIVDEAGLDRAIEAEFGSEMESNPKEWEVKPSEWSKGAPPRMMDLVVAATGGGRAGGVLGGQRGALGKTALLTDRVKKIAEALTGGKMNSQERL